jgi:hypothetical protein
VVIGGGIRPPPRSLAPFETGVNIIHKVAPNAAIAFTRGPRTPPTPGRIGSDHAGIALPTPFLDLCDRHGDAGVFSASRPGGREGSEKSTVSGFWPTNTAGARLNVPSRQMPVPTA